MMTIRPKITVLLSLCIVAAGLVASLPGQADDAGDDKEILQPGIRAYNANGGGCTLGFAFDGSDGTVYFGWAGHCGSVGMKVRSDEIEFGEVVYSEYPYTDPGAYDFALIQVDPEHEAKVMGEVKGQPGVPTGVTENDETGLGHPVRFSGYGTGYSTTSATQENRRGAMVNQASFGEYCVSGLVHWGDSGGPVVHELTGTALGIVSRMGLDCAPWYSSLTGPTVVDALARAKAAGFELTLRTA